MEALTDSPKRENSLKSHLKLALICVALGCMVYFLGWANNLPVSVLISLGIGFTIRLSRYWLNTQYPNMSMLRQYAFSVALSFILWGLTPLLLVLILPPADYGASDVQRHLGVFLLSVVIMCVVSFVYYRSEQTQKLKHSLFQAELEQVRKDKLLLETQLRLLQSQIEPHFLFNTLANIQALMSIDTRQANEMLTALTTLLRQSLDRTRTEWLTLGHELRFNKAYLAIQKIRLGERLDIEFEVADDVSPDTLFPPMLLQPLIENAITHGIEQCREGGKLVIKVQRERDNMLISLVNSVSLQGSQRKGTQVGLRNVSERINQLYGERGALNYDDSAAGWVNVTMEVPIDVSEN